jgi:hypothetical protein
VTGPEAQLPAIDAFVGAGGTAAGATGSAGTVAALNVALAADLTAQAAHASPAWAERGGALAQADAIRDRAISLAGEVEQTYREALSALERAVDAPAPADGESGLPPAPGGETGRPRAHDGETGLGGALTAVLDALLRIGAAGSDAAVLAELVAASGAALVRANAVAATILATAAAEVCAHLVEINLLMTRDDERVGQARELVAAAAAARQAALSLGR